MAPPPLLLRGLSLLCLRLHQPLAGGAAPAPRRFRWTKTYSSTDPEEREILSDIEPITALVKDILHSKSFLWLEDLCFSASYEVRRESLAEKLRMTGLDILPKYSDGETLKAEDEKAVTEQLLVYHPNYEDKIGSGLSCVIVDWHPEYATRCLFVVRTDGRREDFSYRKCLQSYVRAKYPSYTESIINNIGKRLVRAVNLYHPRLVPPHRGLAPKE